MKIENVTKTVSEKLLHKGVMESSSKQMKEQETERMKSALEGGKKTTGFENKGFHFDASA